jgi:hypothetical protein
MSFLCMCKFKKSLWNEEVIGFVISTCSGGSNFVQYVRRKRIAFVPRIISSLNLLQELSQILGQELKIKAKKNLTDWFLEDLTEFFTLIRFISRKEDWLKAILKALGKEPSWLFYTTDQTVACWDCGNDENWRVVCLQTAQVWDGKVEHLTRKFGVNRGCTRYSPRNVSGPHNCMRNFACNLNLRLFKLYKKIKQCTGVA